MTGLRSNVFRLTWMVCGVYLQLIGILIKLLAT